jgi:hypothetical protein
LLDSGDEKAYLVIQMSNQSNKIKLSQYSNVEIDPTEPVTTIQLVGPRGKFITLIEVDTRVVLAKGQIGVKWEGRTFLYDQLGSYDKGGGDFAAFREYVELN